MGEWRIAPLGRSHDRSAFDCGEPVLDEFLRRYARQNQDKGMSRTFVATRGGEPRVLGFFTLSAGSVAFEVLPDDVRRRLPGHPVPVVLLGRLAVDRAAAGQGLGERLVVEALTIALRVAETVGAVAVEVVAKGDAARGFYERYGFRPLEDDRLHLFLPMATVRRVLASGQG